ncbi:UNVERIFIED_CONTAM: hypothetical protein K2H54_043876 [Gekko kuhli]
MKGPGNDISHVAESDPSPYGALMSSFLFLTPSSFWDGLVEEPALPLCSIESMLFLWAKRQVLWGLTLQIRRQLCAILLDQGTCSFVL